MKRLQTRKLTLTDTPSIQEFCYEIHNPTGEDVWLDEFELFHADSLAELGVEAEGCRLFRTGRHKNDMPSVAVLGRMDDAMRDALGSMSETGDRNADAPGQRTIVSDHLTLLGSSRRCCMIAFMTGRSQLFHTRIRVDERGGFLSLSAGVELRRFLRPGETICTETLRVGQTSQPEAAVRRFAQEKARAEGARRCAPPSVFCTWYYYGLTVTQEDVLTNLTRMEAQRLPFDVFQIDEGWERTLGWWEGNAKFPMPMDQLAARIRQAGYRPGIWTSPFVAHETAPVWQEHPEWMLREKDGSPCIFPMNDTVYRVFDITAPGTHEYFTELYRRLTFDWGYTYHKLDFTRAAVIYENADFHDKHITLAAAYREAVAAIRRGMGEDAYFLMCGGLYDPIIGLVDAQRSGSDVLSMWSSTINKGGKTAPYTIKQSLLRWYMNEWWHNDPDALMIRRNPTMERGLRLTYGLLNDDEVRTVVANQLTGGGIVCSTEPLDRIDEDRLMELRLILPPMDTRTEPLALMESGRFPDSVRVAYPQDGRVLLVLINWSDTEAVPASVTISGDVLGCPVSGEDRFAVSSYYDGTYETDARAGSAVSLGSIPPHGTAVIKIERIDDTPVVLASDAHYSMGLELDRLCLGEECLIAEGENRFAVPAHYSVLIPCSGEVVRFTLPPLGRHALRIPLRA
ncbi:MAG: alpha-galactosidase [Clostridia bacterium]|nr:alpha-galactosidase [Clostridia bacterium]